MSYNVAYEQQAEAIINAHLNDELVIKKLRSPANSRHEYYWVFSDNEGVIDMAFYPEAAAEIVQWIQDYKREYGLE